MNLRYLITGASGFVGRHLIDFLYENDNDVTILGLDYEVNVKANDRVFFKECDLTKFDVVKLILKEYQPDYLIHLAAVSSVGESWRDPAGSFKNNLNIFINIVEAVKEQCKLCRILSVGSSEEYGIISSEKLPIKETESLNPNSPYSVARVSQELLSKVYVDGYDLDIVMTRSFNHIGPGQNTRFVIPSFIEKVKKSEKKIKVGNLSIVRDFTDVRDVVNAYHKLAINGKKGEVYNVCSNIGYEIKELLSLIIKKLNKSGIEIFQDPSLIRPSEIPVTIGDNTKIKNELNWEPTITIEKTIDDMISFNRQWNK